MSQHLSTQRAQEYRQRALTEVELLAVDEHLAACEECRTRVSSTVEIGSVVSDFHRRLLSDLSGPEFVHHSYEQLETLVDGELNDSERYALESHLKICETCAEELADLRAFRTDLLGSNKQESARAIRPSFTKKIRALAQAEHFFVRPVFAGALALLLIGGLAALFFAWTTSRSPQRDLQVTNPRPESSPEPSTVSVAPAPSPQQEVTPDAPFVAELNDLGSRVTLDADGNVRGLPPLPAASSQSVKRALTTGQVEVAELSELTGKKGRLLSPLNDGVSFSLISPVGIVTRNAKPTLRWEALSGATSYTVAILDTSYNVVVTSPPLTSTSWPVPVDLGRGRVYSWQVTSLREGKQNISPAPPEPEARFKILDKATEDEVTSVEKAVNSHLVRGTVYSRAGLLDEAEKELRSLVSANPKSQLARELLQSLRAKRRR